MTIKKVAVIGAGVMGAGIAAQISNAGVPVLLLDIVPSGVANRNIIAETARQKLLKTEPPALMHKHNLEIIQTGNIEDDFAQLAEVDWIIEAVIEDLAVKQDLYRKLLPVCRADTLISSNTSTLPLQILCQNLPESFKQRFMITHFFNPPRYMRLLELVADSSINSDLFADITEFADIKLGKGWVECHDTPGFIANRIGTFWALSGMMTAIELGLTIEEADTVIAKPFGIPKTGIFGLLDLIGLDLVPHILDAFKRTLSPEDPLLELNHLPSLVGKLVAEGYTGRKGKGGFYRLHEQQSKRIKEAIDLGTGEYRASVKPDVPQIGSDLRQLMTASGKMEQFAWRVMSSTLCYVAGIAEQIADDINAVDTAMKLGYHWQYGPFELLDRFGVAWFVERLQAEGRQVPELLIDGKSRYRLNAGQQEYLGYSAQYYPVHRSPGVLSLADIKLSQSPILSNRSASLWDIGDHVICLEFHSKMNTLDMETMALINSGIAQFQSQSTAWVIYNEAENFSAGANLNLLIQAIHSGLWDEVEDFLKQGQHTFLALKRAPFPVVGAPSGLALGGGCEILLHCDAIQAHAELYAGLVETGVGLIPGWGGCKELLHRQLNMPKRLGGPIPPLAKTFETIAMAKVTQSAAEAKELGFLRKNDGITMNRDRLLADAKNLALTLAKNYQPPAPYDFKLPGKTAQIVMAMAAKAYQLIGKASAYDAFLSGQLAEVLSGGDTDITDVLTEQDLLTLERKVFLNLVKQPETIARLEFMLKTGKALRN